MFQDKSVRAQRRDSGGEGAKFQCAPAQFNPWTAETSCERTDIIITIKVDTKYGALISKQLLISHGAAEQHNHLIGVVFLAVWPMQVQ